MSEAPEVCPKVCLRYEICVHSTAPASLPQFWFDPLYIEDPLRPSNNVGRNCFRIYAIQQEFSKAAQQCVQHDLELSRSEYPILSRLLRELLPS